IAVLSIKGQKNTAPPIKVNKQTKESFENLLPFALTKEQQKAVLDIEKDLYVGFAMNRILQGDVGSGKTAVALAAAYYMYAAGYQTALMAPTETLAMQHLQTAQKIFAKSPVKCGLLTGGMKAKDRREALQNIQNGEWDIVIGTHALISEGVIYNKLGLVITDEQHRFGVRQRKKLSDKGESPHVLVLSATPIPRTLALVLYGDLEVSTIRSSPPGRLPVKTGIVPENRREKMYQFIVESVQKGEQVYYICPLVEDSETSEAKSAQDMYRQLSKGPFNKLRLGLTYGSQNAEEKSKAIGDFSKGITDVLVATTVVEVGIDVPNANIIVIEDADRFGLSQLHQLRGRVGRGSRQSWCFLMGKPNERLKALCETNDGFEIAKKDLELRGPGQFLGTMQHGKNNAEMFYDALLLEDAQKCAIEINENKSPDNQKIIDAAMRRFSYATSDIALN
ncbi:MAG: ATP-dependent DNA helicase RecG, partial [Eubacteriales bacterium]|nr:ATP-dependent DNA helicase RecG [Eubacteriales bacterium]